jgi:hypothetical protein
MFRGSSLSHLAQFLTACLAHPELLSIGKDNEAICRSFPVNFAYSVQIDYRRPMNANELTWIELTAQIGNGFAQHQSAAIRVKTAVIFSCLDPVDRLNRDKNLFRAILHEKAGLI